MCGPRRASRTVSSRALSKRPLHPHPTPSGVHAFSVRRLPSPHPPQRVRRTHRCQPGASAAPLPVSVTTTCVTPKESNRLCKSRTKVCRYLRLPLHEPLSRYNTPAMKRPPLNLLPTLSLLLYLATIALWLQSYMAGSRTPLPRPRRLLGPAPTTSAPPKAAAPNAAPPSHPLSPPNLELCSFGF